MLQARSTNYENCNRKSNISKTNITIADKQLVHECTPQIKCKIDTFGFSWSLSDKIGLPIKINPWPVI